MRRADLEHVIRASAAITGDKSLVVGSQAVLFSYPDAPCELLLSNEVDLCPAMHPERADLIDGAIGQRSTVDDTFGYFAVGVGPQPTKRSADCKQFAKGSYIGDADADWVRRRFRHDLIKPDRILERIAALRASDYPGERLQAGACLRQAEATP